MPAEEGGSDKKGFRSFIAGAVAGCFEVTLTMPLDVIKTTLQLKPGHYTSPLHCLKDIIQKKGIRGAYYGMSSVI